MQAAVEEPAKHRFHPRLQPAPLHSEAGKEAFQLSLQGMLATHHHIPIGDVEHSWGALKGSLNIPSVHLTVTRAGGKPVTGSLPTATKLGELLAVWAQGQGLEDREAIQVFHQGTAVDKGCWGRSFAELGCGSSLVLDVQVQAHQQPVAVAGPAQQQGAVSQEPAEGEQ